MTSPLATGIVSTYPVVTGNSNVDPLLVWGYKWGSGLVGTPVTVTYSFPSVGATWIGDYWDSEPFTSFTSFNAAQKTAARQALAAWAEVANISFTEVPDTPSDVGDIRFGNSGAVTNSSSAAWAYFPYSDPNFEFPEAGDVWFDGAYAPNLQLQPGQFGYSTMLHEIGHAIGLDHPFADVPGELALPANLDTDQYTVMSYTEAPTLAYASSPQLLDILAIQYIYGANMTTRTGNDVYKFSATAQTNSTIWDAGGIDTLDLSNQVGSTVIDLNEGTYSQFCKHAPTDTSSLLGIAYGVVIENAIGGSGYNEIYGNSAANKLVGGGGEDYLVGAIGNDVLLGNGGTDYLDGNEGSDQITGGAGIDYLRGHEGDDWLDGGVDHDNLHGHQGKDTLLGGAGDDFLVGGHGIAVGDDIGDDYLDGGTGADEMWGGAGNDTYVVDAANDGIDEQGNLDSNDKVLSTISVNLSILGAGLVEHATLLGTAARNATGNASSNTLTGNDGANVLNGGGGADAMIGGKGADTYVVNHAGDQVIETIAGSVGGVDLVRSSIGFSLTSLGNVENVTLLGTAAINAGGNGLNNVITGNDGANRLNGYGGNDTMTGGKGGDTYVVNSAGDIVNETVLNSDGGGVDTVESTVTFTLATQTNIENLTLAGGGAINGTGNAFDNVMIGNARANSLDGAAGHDTLIGGGGIDTLIGGTDNDLLHGGDGADESTGGAGRDTFDFDHLSEAGDTITDFLLGVAGDVLDIHDLLSDVGYVGSNPFLDEVVSFNNVGADTLVSIDADGIGVGTGITLATLTNITLTQANTDNYLV